MTAETTAAIDPAQLASVELHLCHLVHPSQRPPGIAIERMGDAQRALVSRYLITAHGLTPLRAECFDAPWKLAVLGGHVALVSLQAHIGGCLLARWSRLVVSGAQARALREQLDATLLAHALSDFTPLRHWQPPREVPAVIGGVIERAARELTRRLWLARAGPLQPWVAAMLPISTPPRSKAGAPLPEHDAALIDELDAVLCGEFAVTAGEAAAGS